MKNIHSSNIVSPDFSNKKDIITHLEYCIMAGKSIKTIYSLGDIENAEQAKQAASKFIKKSPKYGNCIPQNEDVIYKILFRAFINNRTFGDELEMFYRQNSGKISQTRIAAGMILGNVANDSYIPETSDPDFSQIVA